MTTKTKKAAPSLVSLEGQKLTVRGLLPLVKMNMERDGGLVPVAFLFGMVDPQSGQALPEVSMQIIALAGEMSEGAKDDFSEALRSRCRESQAVGVAFVCEAWSLDISASQKDETATALRTGRLSGHPDRKEIVIISLENREGKVTWVASVLRAPDDQPTLGEWVEAPLQAGAGRFVGLLSNL